MSGRRRLASSVVDGRCTEIAPPGHQPGPWFQATDKQRDRATARLRVVERAEALVLGGVPRMRADALAAEEAGVSASTLARWRKLVRGAAQPAAALLDQPGRGRRGRDWESPELAELWRLWCSDYLRPERPDASACWRRLAAVAAARGWQPPPNIKAFLRRTASEVSRRERVRARHGAVAVMDTVPCQTRTVEGMRPMDALNGDGKKHDIVVHLPSGRVGRPVVWYWQDVYSRRVLGYAAGETESQDLLRRSLHDVVTRHGVPVRVILDNTWAASARSITGGQHGRKRWRSVTPDDELPGLLTLLGIRYSTTSVDRDAAGRGVGRGRAKPVERGFGDLARTIDTHPLLAGAYTGRSVLDRPETHRQEPAAWETFLAVVEDSVREHNARPGRRTEAAAGGSFDDAWRDSLTRTVVRQISGAQARVLLLSAEAVRVDRAGCVTLRAGSVPHRPANRYHHPDLVERAGQELVARYDPERLHDPIQIYDRAGRWLVEAACLLPVGFLDAAGARDYSRARRQAEKHARRAVAARRDMDALAAAQSGLSASDPPVARPAAVRLVNGPGLPADPRFERQPRKALMSALRELRRAREKA